MRALVALVFSGLFFASSPVSAAEAREEALRFTDPNRAREIPVQMYFPGEDRTCTVKNPCPVAFISPGYGVPHTAYTFIATSLASQGYLVAAIQHDLLSDPPLARTGDLVTIRTPMWRRGAENLRFLHRRLSTDYPGYAWSDLTLIGHSNGGDISAYALQGSPDLAKTLVTLDNRRVPLPRNHMLRLLSVRGSDFPADPGVLPTEAEQSATGACIVQIPQSRHDDMLDEGPASLRAKISALVAGFLQQHRCGS